MIDFRRGMKYTNTCAAGTVLSHEMRAPARKRRTILENGIEKRERIVSNLSEQVKALGGAGTEGLNIRV